MDEATRAALASGRAEPALALFIDSLMEMRGLSVMRAGGRGRSAGGRSRRPRCLPDALERVFAAIEMGAGRAGRLAIRN